jgi:hypothetical protein
MTKISGLEVLGMLRGNYTPKGAKEPTMIISCIATPMKMFVDVELTGEDVGRLSGKVKKGMVLELELSAGGRVNIPFAGSPLKISGAEAIKVV